MPANCFGFLSKLARDSYLKRKKDTASSQCVVLKRKNQSKDNLVHFPGILRTNLALGLYQKKKKKKKVLVKHKVVRICESQEVLQFREIISCNFMIYWAIIPFNKDTDVCFAAQRKGFKCSHYNFSQLWILVLLAPFFLYSYCKFNFHRIKKK